MKQVEVGLSSQVTQATKWSAISNILRKMISPLTNMVLARILTPDAFGVVATINMVVSFAEVFTDAGFQKYLVQHEFKDEKHLFNAANVAFWTNFGLSVAIWAIIFFLRAPLAALVGSEGYGLHLTVAALAIPLLAFSTIQQALFRRAFDFKGMFTARLVNAMIPLVITIPLALVTKNCWSLIVGTLAAGLSDAVLLTLKSKWKPNLRCDFKELKRMFSFSAWTMLESLSIWLTLNIDIFILGKVLSDYYLGIYKAANTSVLQITTLVTTTIIPVLFAALARNQNNEENFNNTIYLFQQKTSILLIPMCVGMFLYSDVVTWILLGSQWEEATQFIGHLGLMQAGTILISNFASEAYRAKGEPKVSFLVQIGYIIVLYLSVTVGIKYDFQVLCAIRAYSLLIFMLMHLGVMRFRYGIRLNKMIQYMRSPIICSVLMSGAAIVLRSMIPDVKLRALSIPVCVIVYFGSCFLFTDTRSTIMPIVSKVLKRKK